MNKIQSYRDLIVWQKAMALVTQIYDATRTFPKEEQYVLTQQIRRAAVSIPSNFAEGNGRATAPDYLNFLHVARGSLFELQTQLELSLNLGYLSEPATQSLLATSNEIERMLNSVISRLRS